jgi:hypothetical protein
MSVTLILFLLYLLLGALIVIRTTPGLARHPPVGRWTKRVMLVVLWPLWLLLFFWVTR